MKTEEKVHELFLNYACTAKCPFCYNPPITPELLRLDLTFEQAAESLYKGAGSGARMLNLHGGEVTLRDDLPKLLRLARKLGFTQITVVTNGVKLGSRAYARGLAAAGATHFRLSIHAPEAALHDAILALPGAFDKAVAALGHLEAEGIPFGLNFVLSRDNLAVLPAFIERFVVRGGIGDVIVYFPHLRGMMALNAARIGLSYEEAAVAVREGFLLLEKAGRRDSVLLANFLPCVLPELTDRMLDWSKHGETASMTHPEGFTQDIHEMKDGQRLPVKACRSCAVGTRCLGVEREYIAARGESEFNAMGSCAVER